MNYLEIVDVQGREILDSRGNPTVEAEITLADGTVARGCAPSGASTGEFEALELRDGDKGRYLGKGVTKAVENINTVIADAVIGMDASDIYAIDKAMIDADGTKDKEVMGNLNTQSWEELWSSPEADAVRAKVRHCDRACWMIGSVSPAMHKYIWKPGFWMLTHKLKALFTKTPYSMYELKVCRDYRDGRVTKEELDRCSTCDLNCVVNNGLSAASQEQLRHKSGEEIVDADLASQLRQ